jgi:hypothetical protein
VGGRWRLSSIVRGVRARVLSLSSSDRRGASDRCAGRALAGAVVRWGRVRRPFQVFQLVLIASTCMYCFPVV